MLNLTYILQICSCALRLGLLKRNGHAMVLVWWWHQAYMYIIHIASSTCTNHFPNMVQWCSFVCTACTHLRRLNTTTATDSPVDRGRRSAVRLSSQGSGMTRVCLQVSASHATLINTFVAAQRQSPIDWRCVGPCRRDGLGWRDRQRLIGCQCRSLHSRPILNYSFCHAQRSFVRDIGSYDTHGFGGACIVALMPRDSLMKRYWRWPSAFCHRV